MNSLEFKVSSYRAIKSANIKIDGITVLSGVNGSGKSTISRSLYYLVNSMCNFSTLVLNDTRKDVIAKISPFFSILRQANINGPKKSFDAERVEDAFYSASTLDSLQDIIVDIIDSLQDVLSPSLTANNERSNRFLKFLGVEEASTNAVNKHFADTKDACLSAIDAARQTEESLPKKRLFNYIRQQNADLEDFKENKVSFVENGENLLRGRQFVPPISLTAAVYVDTPMAINGNINFTTPNWHRLVGLMSNESIKPQSSNVSSLTQQVQGLLHGKVTKDWQRYNSSTGLLYEREDGLSIKLENVATGFKTFAYLLRLLDNGTLRQDSLLLIDEPEAHLHPQWVVELAKVLVLLNQKVGVPIVITSHSTDMVLAIQSIAENLGTLNSVRFYLAEEADNYQFSYRDLGTDIEPIFACFNKSLEKIEQYGGGCNL